MSLTIMACSDPEKNRITPRIAFGNILKMIETESLKKSAINISMVPRMTSAPPVDRNGETTTRNQGFGRRSTIPSPKVMSSMWPDTDRLPRRMLKKYSSSLFNERPILHEDTR